MKWTQYQLRAAMLVICVASMLLCVACAQNTEANVRQTPRQEVVTPTVSNQDAATRGSTINVYVTNAPDRAAPGATLGRVLPASSAIQPAEAIATGVQTADAGLGETSGAFVQTVTLNISTGNTTPTLTGTQTPTITGTQTSSAAPVANPVQDVKPELTSSVPIAVVLPGGVNDQQAAATGKGSTSGTSKSSDNDVTNNNIRVLTDRVTEAIGMLQTLIGKLNAVNVDVSTKKTEAVSTTMPAAK